MVNAHCSSGSYKQPEVISGEISLHDVAPFLVIDPIELRDLRLILGEQSGSHCLVLRKWQGF
jgi:hypothetical protein